VPASAGSSSERPAEAGTSSFNTPSASDVRVADERDAAVLTAIAAVTFPLACPPTTTDAAKADFIARHLSLGSFQRYLADPERMILLAEYRGRPAGYTMLVFAEPTDTDVLAVVRPRPTVELSKCYVLPELHGHGLASALIDASVAAATQRGARSMWLGVNQFNSRANRFYEKSGFTRIGVKRFLVGDVWEHDFVRERILEGAVRQ
jgi:diamine N-acetyltransferase